MITGLDHSQFLEFIVGFMERVVSNHFSIFTPYFILSILYYLYVLTFV